MGGEGLDAEGILVAVEQGHDLVDPAFDVGLAHAQLDLLVEQVHHRHRVDLPAVHAAEGDRPASPDQVDREVQRGHAVDAGLLDHLLGDRIGEEAGHRLGQLPEGRALRLHSDGVDHGVGPRPSVSALTAAISSSESCFERSSVSTP